MKFQQESRAQEQRKVGPSGRGGATLGDVLKEKLGSVLPPATPAVAADDDDDDDEDESDEE